MKINISIITWINRLLMIPFIILLIICTIDNEFISLTAILALIVGCYELFSLLFILFYINKIVKHMRYLILIYTLIVVFYFSSIYFFYNFYETVLKNQFFNVFYYSLPVLLALYWTYILESIKKKI
jgi:hypothetical protein